MQLPPWFVLAATLGACANVPSTSPRAQRILDALADDNYVTMQREPALVALKLAKMQRGPYEWLRGTASLYWRDLLEPGADRPATEFGDPASSRVLLVGDPHPENVGTFRASDGTMFADWNDFDATGYGPYTGDLRRLAAGFVVIAGIGAPGDDVYAGELAMRVARGYATEMARLAAGGRPVAVPIGTHAFLDGELTKARTRGDAHHNLDEVAPLTDGVRALAVGDLEDVAPDGVIEDRVLAVDAETAAIIDRAVALWDPAARVLLRGRRIGSGVSSYAVYRFFAVLDGDRLIELKETRDGIVVRGVPQREAGEWANPAVRAVETQRRLQARPDGDGLLGAAHLGGLSLEIRDREAYQRGVDAADLAELAGGSAAKRASLAELAELFGRMLARAHGEALTDDRIRGVDAIAPLVAGRDAAFVDEIVRDARADAAQVVADHALEKDADLAAAIGGP